MTDQKTLGSWIKLALAYQNIKETTQFYIYKSTDNKYHCCALGLASIGKRLASKDDNACENAYVSYISARDADTNSITYFTNDLGIPREISLLIINNHLNNNQKERVSADGIADHLMNNTLARID